MSNKLFSQISLMVVAEVRLSIGIRSTGVGLRAALAHVGKCRGEGTLATSSMGPGQYPQGFPASSITNDTLGTTQAIL